MDKIENFIKENDIQVGVIAVPDTEASKTMDRLIDAGIRGILNFAPVELKCSRSDCPVNTAIHNVNIALELEHLFYQVNSQNVAREEED
jgi:redox-sensing transcriptional repressor